MKKNAKCIFIIVLKIENIFTIRIEIHMFEGGIYSTARNVTSCKKETLKTNISATQRSTTTYRVQLQYQDLPKNFIKKSVDK